LKTGTNPESIAAYGEYGEVGEIWECIEPVVQRPRAKSHPPEGDVEVPKAAAREGHGLGAVAAVAEGTEA
jgi:hypothetical protein